MFENCYPNTLDTTVKLGTVDGKPDAFVITGDINALWLRDSSAQIQTYVHLAPQDADLRRVFHGLIQRQARCILIDSYANAFMEDPTAPSSLSALGDKTDMKPGVAERKWEIDPSAIRCASPMGTGAPRATRRLSMRCGHRRWRAPSPPSASSSARTAPAPIISSASTNRPPRR
jgi:hypothetical protein